MKTCSTKEIWGVCGSIAEVKEYAGWENWGQCRKGAIELRWLSWVGLDMWAGFQHTEQKKPPPPPPTTTENPKKPRTPDTGDVRGETAWLTEATEKLRVPKHGLGCWWKKRGRLEPNHESLRCHASESGFYPLHSGIHGYFLYWVMRRWDLHVMLFPMLALWKGRKTGLGDRRVGHCDWRVHRLGKGPKLWWGGDNPDLRDVSEE